MPNNKKNNKGTEKKSRVRSKVVDKITTDLETVMKPTEKPEELRADKMAPDIETLIPIARESDESRVVRAPHLKVVGRRDFEDIKIPQSESNTHFYELESALLESRVSLPEDALTTVPEVESDGMANSYPNCDPVAEFEPYDPLILNDLLEYPVNYPADGINLVVVFDPDHIIQDQFRDMNRHYIVTTGISEENRLVKVIEMQRTRFASLIHSDMTLQFLYTSKLTNFYALERHLQAKTPGDHVTGEKPFMRVDDVLLIFFVPV